MSSRVKKLFIDTNIILDVAMGRKPWWAPSAALIDEISYGKAQGYVAATSLKDIYCVLSKFSDEPHARAFIEDCLRFFDIAAIDQTLCQLALVSDEEDFEDALVRACAEAVEADFIISRDETAYRRSRIKRLSAQEYIELFCDLDEVELDA